MGLRGKVIVAGAVAVFAATGGHAAVSKGLQAVSATGGTLSCTGLEQLWERAGGSRGTAFMAAEIATAESGGNQYALSGTDDVGYFQINRPIWGPAMATYDPLGNARAAVIISHDGTDWSPWTTFQTSAYIGKC